MFDVTKHACVENPFKVLGRQLDFNGTVWKVQGMVLESRL